MSNYEKCDPRSGNKVAFGVVIILIGIVVLLKQMGLLSYFSFYLSWPVLLIVIGLIIGVKNRFRNIAPFVLIAVGVFNLIPAFTFNVGNNEVDSEDLVVPALLILGGILVIFKPRKKKPWMPTREVGMSDDNSVRADIVFGGRKEIITSKDFNGGKITATFGGCEVNLLQADSTKQNIILDVRATFGGIEIIVPANWDVKNEVEPVFGSVEDQRTLRPPDGNEHRKTLILQGSCVFGGVEIKSF